MTEWEEFSEGLVCNVCTKFVTVGEIFIYTALGFSGYVCTDCRDAIVKADKKTVEELLR